MLLVEDNEVNRLVAVKMLEQLGLTVDVAENGREAVDAAGRSRYDVVLMDCQMPEMDGFEATRRIRGRESANAAPRVPIIALTAHALSGDRQQCLDAGMDDYLSKPFSEVQLRECVGRHLSLESRLARQSAEPLDAARVDRLRRLPYNGRSLLDAMAEVYLDDSVKLLARVRAAIDGRDDIALARAAHTLKSSSGNVGAVRVAEIAGMLEDVGRGLVQADAAMLRAALETEHEAAQAALRRAVSPGLAPGS